MQEKDFRDLQKKTNRNGAPGAIRTPDPLIRSQILYPAELRARSVGNLYNRALGDDQVFFEIQPNSILITHLILHP